MLDVTDKVDFQNAEDEALPLTKCVCGAQYPPWSEIISIYVDSPWVCPTCGVKLIFKSSVRVFQLTDEA